MFALTVNTDVEVCLDSRCPWSLTKYSFEPSYSTQSPVISHQWDAVLHLGNCHTQWTVFGIELASRIKYSAVVIYEVFILRDFEIRRHLFTWGSRKQ